jgi:CBS domain-containing protein
MGMSMSGRVKDYMERDFFEIDIEASALEASKTMMAKSSDYLLVLEKERPVGIVTDLDLVLKVMATEKDPSKVKVSEIMSTPLIMIDPDATVEEAIEVLIEHGIRRLPVARDDIFYGLFTGRDLGKHFQEYEERVAGDIIKHMSLVSRLLGRVGY